jgi:hypothetical protein
MEIRALRTRFRTLPRDEAEAPRPFFASFLRNLLSRLRSLRQDPWVPTRCFFGDSTTVFRSRHAKAVELYFAQPLRVSVSLTLSARSAPKASACAEGLCLDEMAKAQRADAQNRKHPLRMPPPNNPSRPSAVSTPWVTLMISVRTPTESGGPSGTLKNRRAREQVLY